MRAAFQPSAETSPDRQIRDFAPRRSVADRAKIYATVEFQPDFAAGSRRSPPLTPPAASPPPPADPPVQSACSAPHGHAPRRGAPVRRRDDARRAVVRRCDAARRRRAAGSDGTDDATAIVVVAAAALRRGRAQRRTARAVHRALRPGLDCPRRRAGHNHVDGTPGGGLTPMTFTDHRGGENYLKNHPWLKKK